MHGGLFCQAPSLPVLGGVFTGNDSLERREARFMLLNMGQTSLIFIDIICRLVMSADWSALSVRTFPPAAGWRKIGRLSSL